jgi:predicted TIM-barrel fold metal-dependent hydrolase
MVSRREFQKGLLGLVTVSTLPQRAIARQPSGSVTAVDSHAHVFKRGLPLADVRRYAPDYDATPEDYIKVLDGNGISHAVLVQPSFLGTDNSYLVDALHRYPRFRGIAVVQPTTSPDELRALDKAGVVGIRLNLIGAPDPQFDIDPWPSLLKRLAELDWQVEVQAEARRWPVLLGPLLKAGVKTVADHFGRPDPALGTDDPGFRHLLSTGRTGRVWVKLSGAYRNGNEGVGERVAQAAIPLLRDSFGVDHLVWGSDWPHTQFESVADYATLRASLDAWFPDPRDRQIVLVGAPASLFKFDTVEQPSQEPASVRQ